MYVWVCMVLYSFSPTTTNKLKISWKIKKNYIYKHISELNSITQLRVYVTVCSHTNIYIYLNTTTNNMCKSHKIHMYMSDLYKCICVFFCLYILFWFFLAWHSSCTTCIYVCEYVKIFFCKIFYKTIIKNFSNIRKIIIENKKQEIQLKRKKNK